MDKNFFIVKSFHWVLFLLKSSPDASENKLSMQAGSALRKCTWSVCSMVLHVVINGLLMKYIHLQC